MLNYSGLIRGRSFCLILLCFSYLYVRPVSTQTSLESIRDQYNLPALAVFAILPNGTFQSAAAGVRRQGDSTPVTVNDTFHLGSNTKAMTATLLAIMIENGTFTWDTTLPEALPQIADMSSGHQNTTLAMLAAHRSGITGEASTKNPEFWLSLFSPDLDPVNGRQEVAQQVLSVEPDETSNTIYSYSNINYIILGHIIDQQGTSWESLMASALWQPLNMTECGFGPVPESSNSSVENPWPHDPASPEPIPYLPLAPNSDNPPTLGPAGTVHCTMQSYSQFLLAHLAALDGSDTAILPASAFVRLHTPPSDQYYTPGGWIVASEEDPYGGRYLVHDGSNTRNYVNAVLAPERDQPAAVAAFTNVGEAGRAVSEAVARWYAGEIVLDGTNGSAPETGAGAGQTSSASVASLSKVTDMATLLAILVAATIYL